jgi:hypothetical protein
MLRQSEIGPRNRAREHGGHELSATGLHKWRHACLEPTKTHSRDPSRSRREGPQCRGFSRMAVRCAAASLPANNQFLRPSSIGRIACSAPWLSILSRPSGVRHASDSDDLGIFAQTRHHRRAPHPAGDATELLNDSWHSDLRRRARLSSSDCEFAGRDSVRRLAPAKEMTTHARLCFGRFSKANMRKLGRF